MFQGSIVALVTPFKAGRLDETSFGDLIEWQIKEGTDAILPCGCTGEAATLSMEEHQRLVTLAVAVVAGRRPVIAGTGSNNTAEALQLTRHAKKAGAEVIVTVCPLCHLMLDARQLVLEQRHGHREQIGIPVLYVTQLVGIALGLGPDELGLDMNSVSPMPMLEKVYERMA